MGKKQSFKEIIFPESRIATFDICEIGRKKHHVTALLEIDVTDARKKIQELKKTFGGLSFTSWIVKCISIAVSEYSEAAAYLNRRNSLKIFDDIDISIMVEKEVNGYKVPLPLVIRKTNEKKIIDIHNEIRQAQIEKATANTIVMGRKGKRKQNPANAFFKLPGFIRRFIWKAFMLKPTTAQKNMGSVMVTSVGMVGRLDGWMIPIGIHPLCFAIGSITKKPGVVNNEIEIREYLKLTVLLDHDVIDGAPASRFVSRLNKLLGNAYGLDEITI